MRNLLVPSLLFLLLTTQSALGHEAKPVWALNSAEQAELRHVLEESERSLIQALSDAAEYRASETREFFHDSESELAEIPRSILNRVLQHSLDLETAQMKSYLFCESGCEQSAKQQGLSQNELQTVRGLWPKIRASFALLAGASAFTGAFVATEIAESMFMGPLHIVCQANYLWSLAFASTIASLSRDVKAALSFNSKHESFLQRLFGAYGRYSLLRRERALEDRVLIKSWLTVASSQKTADSQRKLTRREAQIQILTPILEAELESPIRRSFAMDRFLWSELVARTGLESASELKPIGTGFSEAWDRELENLGRKSQDEVRLWWRDAHASLRTLLRLQTVHSQTLHTLGDRQQVTLRQLGALDRTLRLWDTTVILSLKTQAGWDSESRIWLQRVTGEWLSLLLALKESDTKSFDLRLRYLEELMKIANRSGGLKPSATESLPATDRLAKAVEVREIRLCEGSFVPVL